MKKLAFTLAELSLIMFIMGIISVLFYRVLKPNEIAYDSLYYSAYQMLVDATREIQSEGGLGIDMLCDNAPPCSINKTTGKWQTNDLASDDCETPDKAKDLARSKNYLLRCPEGRKLYAQKFAELVNMLEDIPATVPPTPEELQPQLAYNDGHYEVDNVFGQLTNGMQIRFDLNTINFDSEDEERILVATVDVNGEAKPNKYGVDRVQFEIYDDSMTATRAGKMLVAPVGDLAENNKHLGFDIYRINDNMAAPDTHGKERIPDLWKSILSVGGKPLTGLTYKEAYCKAIRCRDYEARGSLCFYNSHDKCDTTPIGGMCTVGNGTCIMEVIQPKGFRLR